MRHSIPLFGEGVRVLALLLFLVGGNLPAATPIPFAPQPAGPLFKQRTIGAIPSPTEPPATRRVDPEDEKPIPREWIFGAIALGVIAALGILYGSARAWRSSNIFDQQYRFLVTDNPALRLGGHRSGGHMATIGVGEGTARGSKAEQA